MVESKISPRQTRTDVSYVSGRTVCVCVYRNQMKHHRNYN